MPCLKLAKRSYKFGWKFHVNKFLPVKLHDGNAFSSFLLSFFLFHGWLFKEAADITNIWILTKLLLCPVAMKVDPQFPVDIILDTWVLFIMQAIQCSTHHCVYLQTLAPSFYSDQFILWWASGCFPPNIFDLLVHDHDGHGGGGFPWNIFGFHFWLMIKVCFACPQIYLGFWRSFFTWWNNFGDIQIALQSESLEECILYGFQIEGDIFSVLNYCILIAKVHIYCHNNNAINLFLYLIELKNKLKIENYICASNSIGTFEKFLFLYEQLQNVN